MYIYVLCIIGIGFGSVNSQQQNDFTNGSPTQYPGQRYESPQQYYPQRPDSTQRTPNPNNLQGFRDVVIPGQSQPYQQSFTDNRDYQSPTFNTNYRQNQNQRNTNRGRGQYDDMSYRYAPSTQRQGPNGEIFIITEERLREIRSEFMYWFFDKGGDDDNGDFQTYIHHSNPQIHKNFNFQLPFFGFRFNYTRVTVHGYLEFSDPPSHLSYPLKFPSKDWPMENDPSFIGIFYSKCRIGELKPTDIDRRRPGVYFRLERDLQSRTDQFGVEMRERLMWDIREGVVGADTFVPKHAAIVTWKNMSFIGGFANAIRVTNTFQLILATDEVYTYAIFNYAEMQWTSHTEAGGDTTSGDGGVSAYVGFNAGNGTRSFEYHPYSQSSTIRDLLSRGYANGFPGRHIFRIDENIMPGTCNKDPVGTSLPLVFAPESGNMLGGIIINITGPCREPNMKIKCRFDTEVVDGIGIDRNRAICVQPFLKVQGYVNFDITIGDENFETIYYTSKGKFFVETPATATEKISIMSEAIHGNSSKENLTITWNRQNLTSNFEARLKLTLWGYKENSSNLSYIDILEDNITNTGSYIIQPVVYSSRNNTDLQDLPFGFLQISLSQPAKYFQHGLSPVLWSKPIPLGWYFAPQFERKYGQDGKWTKELCNNWIANDRHLSNFTSELPQCPCTLEQALADKGRYLSDNDCDMEFNPSCIYNIGGARHCVKTGVPSLGGSEQQCCYDKNNYLMSTYDQQGGSKPRRSHNLGYSPWGDDPRKVPTLSQWLHDITPFYSCCLWQGQNSEGCETFRFERRPSQDCIAYKSPYVATVFGDPHFITFDDVEYTFNGKGEFVLVHTLTDEYQLDVQGRFQQVTSDIYGPLKATRLTSVAARENNSTIIEVRLRPQEAQWRYRLDILADGKRVYFDKTYLKLQHFQGVTVHTPMGILNQSEVVIMFKSGVGIEVLENKGSMSARVYLPREFINQTKGLLGTRNFGALDYFTLPHGGVLNINRSDFRSIHENFGTWWILEDRYERDKGEALFYREYGRTANYYANRSFQAEYGRNPQEILLLNRTADVLTANNICGNSYQCKYDYSITLDKEFSKNTLKFHNSFEYIKKILKEKVITCGVLETPRFGRKSNFLFTPGTKVIFECIKDFVLVGDQKRTCTIEGKWNVPEYGYTKCLSQSEYESRTARTSTSTLKP